MSALSLAGGAVVAGVWKVATVVQAVLLLMVIAGAGTGWWLAAARDQALARLVVEQGASAALRASIDIQNSAVKSMQDATIAADRRRRAAEALAVVAGRRYDSAQAKLTGARAITCDEAMPFVDQLLKDVK